MAVTNYYADASVSGNVTTPANAIGAPNGTWTGDTGSVSWTHRWSMGNPVGTLIGVQNINLTARKQTGSGNPTLVINLYVGANLVASSSSLTVSSATGQTVSLSFDASLITDSTAVDVEIVTTAAGGGPSARAAVQIDAIGWAAQTVDVIAKSASDTGNISAVESSSVIQIVAKAGADSGTISSTESGSVFSFVPQSPTIEDVGVWNEYSNGAELTRNVNLIHLPAVGDLVVWSVNFGNPSLVSLSATNLTDVVSVVSTDGRVGYLYGFSNGSASVLTITENASSDLIFNYAARAHVFSSAGAPIQHGTMQQQTPPQNDAVTVNVSLSSIDNYVLIVDQSPLGSHIAPTGATVSNYSSTGSLYSLDGSNAVTAIYYNIPSVNESWTITRQNQVFAGTTLYALEIPYAAPPSSDTPVSGSDSGSLTSTETSDVVVSDTQVSKSGSDSGSISAAESSSIIASVAVSSTDTGSFNSVESTINSSTGSSTDSGSISSVESTNILSIRPGTDGGTLVSSEAGSVVLSGTVVKSATDSGSINAVESGQVASTVTSSDAGSISAVESGVLVKNVTATDSGSLSATESRTVASSSSRSDSGSLSAVESSGIFKTISASDSGSINSTETGVVFFARPGADSGVLSAVETADIVQSGVIEKSAADLGSLSGLESTSISTVLSRSDLGSLSAVESTSSFRQISVSDAGSLSAVDSSATFKTVASSDSGSLNAIESGGTFTDRPGADSGILSITESSDIVVSGTVTKSAADSGSISALESQSLFVSVDASDSGQFTAVEDTYCFIDLSASDSGTISVVEGSNVYDPTTGRVARIWNGSGYTQTIIKVWNGTQYISPILRRWNGVGYDEV